MIPKTLLEDATEVDIRKESGRVVVFPVPKDDPIFRIGKNPLAGGVTDASVEHDKYIYRAMKRFFVDTGFYDKSGSCGPLSIPIN